MYLRQQMQQRQAQKVGPGKGVQQFHVLGLVQPEDKHTQGAQNNAGKEQQVIHANCKSFAFGSPKKLQPGVAGPETISITSSAASAARV